MRIFRTTAGLLCLAPMLATAVNIDSHANNLYNPTVFISTQMSNGVNLLPGVEALLPITQTNNSLLFAYLGNSVQSLSKNSSQLGFGYRYLSGNSVIGLHALYTSEIKMQPTMQIATAESYH